MQGKRLFLLMFISSLVLTGLGVVVVNAVSDYDKVSNNNITFFSYKNELGAGGYDVVAYFDENQAVVGKKVFTANFGGIPWRFSSFENQEKFTKNPAHYLPKYGGHCAYGVAQGYLVRGDPQAWSIHNGALYFNYNKNIRGAWLADADSFIRRSENNWLQLNSNN